MTIDEARRRLYGDSVRLHRTVVALLAALASLGACALPASADPPPIKHVFIVVLENSNYKATFGQKSKAPYLSNELPKQGQLLTQYYGIGHESLDNYIAMISGQSPNPQTQADCQIFSAFTQPVPGATAPGEQAIGNGCVYPGFVTNIADQLQAKGRTWKAYLQDMGNDPQRDNGRRCAHPPINSQDHTQSADKGDQYAARHNPFVYFHSTIDGPYCKKRDVPLSKLPKDLDKPDDTANYSFIVPNLCNSGHDEPCVDGRPGGLKSADRFLKHWIPRILGSRAFKRDGLLIVTFDEAEGEPPDGDASSCCNEPTGPNTPNNGGPVPGNGGGRIGAVLVSPFIKPGTRNDTPYNHYALLRSVEDIFNLKHLGYAGQSGLRAFGHDVYGR